MKKSKSQPISKTPNYSKKIQQFITGNNYSELKRLFDTISSNHAFTLDLHCISAIYIGLLPVRDQAKYKTLLMAQKPNITKNAKFNSFFYLSKNHTASIAGIPLTLANYKSFITSAIRHTLFTNHFIPTNGAKISHEINLDLMSKKLDSISLVLDKQARETFFEELMAYIISKNRLHVITSSAMAKTCAQLVDFYLANIQEDKKQSQLVSLIFQNFSTASSYRTKSAPSDEDIQLIASLIENKKLKKHHVAEIFSSRLDDILQYPRLTNAFFESYSFNSFLHTHTKFEASSENAMKLLNLFLESKEKINYSKLRQLFVSQYMLRDKGEEINALIDKKILTLSLEQEPVIKNKNISKI